MPDNTNRDSPVTAAPSDRRPLADRMKECLAVPTEKSSECYAEKLMEELDIGFEPPMRRWNRDAAWGLIAHDEATEWVHLAVLALYVHRLNACETDCGFDFLNNAESYYESTSQNRGRVSDEISEARNTIGRKLALYDDVQED